jgi:hypothetical protein
LLDPILAGDSQPPAGPAAQRQNQAEEITPTPAGRQHPQKATNLCLRTTRGRTPQDYDPGVLCCDVGWNFHVYPGATASGDTDRESDAHMEAPEELEEDVRDRFLAALTEILRSAVSERAHDRASVLKELAAAADALANTLDPDRVEP